MIRIRILTSLATMSRTYEKGDEADWDAEDAKKLFAAGYAEPLELSARTQKK